MTADPAAAVEDPILEVRELEVGYGGRPAIRDVDLYLGSGETIAVLGANGAGKTTLLRGISGSLTPSAGSVVLDGRDITRLSTDDTLRAGIAHVLEGRRVFNTLSVEENLLLGGQVLETADRARELEGVYEVFPALRDHSGLPGRALSGGQQQMLAIGRALMARPRVLLLDEPSLGLSPLLVQTLGELLAEMQARFQMSIVLVEQTVLLALSLASRVYTMELGELTETGAADQLDASTLSQAYLGKGPVAGDG